MVDGEHSESVHVDSGVPQGTVMGPLLFLMYINDLPDSVLSHVRLFADDCLLYRPVKTLEDQIKLQQDLNALSKWSDTWGMKFNPSKCYILSTCKGNKLNPYLYSLCGCVLSNVQNSTYLGVTISENLQWNNHISAISAKACKILGFLRRNLKGCPRDLKQLAYFSLIRSKLEYASAIWDPHLEKDKDILNRTQRRGARFVCNDYKRDSSVTAMLETLKWDTLEERRRKARITLMDKIVGGRVAINQEEYLTKGTTRTRSANSVKFRTIGAKTLIYKNSFFPRTIPQWNSTPDSIVAEIGADIGTNLMD